MGLFDIFRKKKKQADAPQQPLESPLMQAEPPESNQPGPANRLDFTRPISAEEKELAAVVTSAILAGTSEDAYLRVRNVTGIDTDKEIAAAIVAAVAAHDKPESSFRLHSITRVK